MKHFLTKATEYTNLDPYYTPLNILKMTAVEYLIEKICGEHTEAWTEEIQQALIMEYEQIIKAYDAGYDDVDVYEPEKYFNETYKKLKK